MTDQPIVRRRAGFTPFPEAPVNEPGVAAVLITRGEDGNLHAYVHEYQGHQGPDPEIVALLTQSVEIRNL